MHLNAETGSESAGPNVCVEEVTRIVAAAHDTAVRVVQDQDGAEWVEDEQRAGRGRGLRGVRIAQSCVPAVPYRGWTTLCRRARWTSRCARRPCR